MHHPDPDQGTGASVNPGDPRQDEHPPEEAPGQDDAGIEQEVDRDPARLRIHRAPTGDVDSPEHMGSEP
jgi:hypothetical protein